MRIEKQKTRRRRTSTKNRRGGWRTTANKNTKRRRTTAKNMRMRVGGDKKRRIKQAARLILNILSYKIFLDLFSKAECQLRTLF